MSTVETATEIRPFNLEITEKQIDDLRRRIAATRWPSKELVDETLYGLADSPVALAAWMLDHDANSLEDISHAFVDGQPVGNLTRDEVLDNITMTWVTNTGISSGRLYWENSLDFFGVKGVTVPAALSVFPRALYQAPRSWAERAYPKLIYFNEVDEGNHFAAWQEPELFTTEVRAAFRSLR